MSHSENDKIWDSVIDKALEDPREAMTYEVIMTMDLEDAFEYLAYGTMPKDYESARERYLNRKST